MKTKSLFKFCSVTFFAASFTISSAESNVNS